MRARGVAIEFAAEDVRGRALEYESAMPPAFLVRLMRRLDMTMRSCSRAALILPAPVHPAAVAPHASHILLMGVGPFGLGVVEHPVVCRLRHAQDPALRRYRAAAGIGPYHACFRANTGAACSETSTSISNRRLRLLNAISSFRSGVWLSTALVEPLLRIPRIHRCRVECKMSHSVLILRAGLPFSCNRTIRRLNSSS